MNHDQERIVHRVLEDLLHRFLVFDRMLLSEGTPDTAFTLDTAEDQAKLELALDLLGFQPRKGVPPTLRELHADLQQRDPALAARIEPFAAAEAARHTDPG